MLARFCKLSIALFLSLTWISELHARPIGSRVRLTTRSLNVQESQLYDFSISREIDKIVSNTVDTDLFDPYTLAELRAMKEISQPRVNSDDIDPEKTRFVVEKALAIQTANSIIPVIQRSDLRDGFYMVRDSMQQITDLFRYSLQHNGDNFSVSRHSKGKKLMELDLHISPKQGFDPQLRIGESVRFRYDWLAHRTMLEYGINF